MFNSKYCFKRCNLLTAQLAIDPAKIRRQMIFWREKKLEQQAVAMNELICIGFDGKHDIIMTQTSGICRKTKEKHYATISYPDRKYIDHVTPESSTAKDVALEILSTITETNFLKTLDAVICDGTVKNTGKRSGVI